MNFRRYPVVFGRLLAAGLLAVSLVGCSSPNQPCTVSGTVAFQEKPVEDGAIRFVAHDKTPGTGGIGPIKDGKYSVTTQGMLSGKYIVMISGFQKTGKKLVIDGNEIEEQTQYIPSQHNTNATEAIELRPGKNTKDFSLQP